MKKITVLACIFLLTFQIYAQKEPPNNDQKLKDSSIQQTTQSSTASTHMPLKEQEWVMIAIFLLIVVAIVSFVKRRKLNKD